MVVLGGVEQEGERSAGHSHQEEDHHQSCPVHPVQDRAFHSNLRVEGIRSGMRTNERGAHSSHDLGS